MTLPWSNETLGEYIIEGYSTKSGNFCPVDSYRFEAFNETSLPMLYFDPMCSSEEPCNILKVNTSMQKEEYSFAFFIYARSNMGTELKSPLVNITIGSDLDMDIHKPIIKFIPTKIFIPNNIK